MSAERFRVLVVDDEDLLLREIRHQLEADDVEVVTVDTQQEALQAIVDRYFDAAIVDIMLDVQDGGYEVLGQLASRSPRAAVIVATSYLDPQHVRDLSRLLAVESPNVVRVVDKNREDPDTWPRTAVEEPLARWRGARVQLDNLELLVGLVMRRSQRIDGLRTHEAEVATELDRALRDLFGGIRGISEGSDVRVELRTIERRGLSTAVTIEAEVSLGLDADGSQVSGSRCVLKVGPVDEMREEAERYERFVKHGVRLAHRVELLSSSYQDSLGAICYSFAGGVFGDNLVSLDELLRSGEEEALAVAAVRSLFAVSSKNWYSVSCDRVSARAYMSNTYQTDFDACFDRLDRSLAKLARELRTEIDYKPAAEGTDGFLSYEGGKLVIPMKRVVGRAEFLFARRGCLVHGDMHGGNVMVELSRGDPEGARLHVERVCLIDYRSAGPGPRAVDGVALQASVRLADAQGVEEDASRSIANKRLRGEALARAIRTIGQRVHAESRLLEETWSGEPPAAESEVVEDWASSVPVWESVSREITWGLRRNFRDMTREEYLAIALPCALRQFAYDISPAARVRILAWVSAHYRLLTDSP